jgi:uncharacterized membrane protein
MNTTIDILRFVTIAASGMLAGGLYVPAIGVFPAVRRLGTATDIRFHQFFDARMDRFFAPLPATALLSGLALLACFRHLTAASILMVSGGVLGALGMVVVTLVFEFPLNRRVKAWTSDQAPQGYAQDRLRWYRFHTLRTLSGVAGFLCFVAAGVFRS